MATPYARSMSSIRARLGRLGILQPLSIRDFAWLWIGMTVSMVGDGIYIVAIAWQVYELSNTPTALAAVGIAWSLPQIILLLGSGVLSDRVDRRHLMIAGDILRLIAMGTVGVLSIAGELTIPLLIGLVVIYGVGQALFGPAFMSIVPSIVPAELLVEANSLGQFVRPFAMTLVGPLIGGAAGGERRRGLGVHRRRADVRVLRRDDHADPRASDRARSRGSFVVLGRHEGRHPVRQGARVVVGGADRRVRQPAVHLGSVGDAGARSS